MPPRLPARPCGDLLPDWVGPTVLELFIAVVLVAGWRARRLGPVVEEPLPVVVRAAEVTEGRARLYRRAKARDRAANELRRATVESAGAAAGGAWRSTYGGPGDRRADALPTARGATQER